MRIQNLGYSYNVRPRSLMGGGRFGRQLSLEGGGKQQQPPATTDNRAFLRRQASEDFRPLKIAWANNETEQSGVEVVAKKCGQPKPTQLKPPRSPFAPDQKTVLFSRQQLTQSLRNSWQKNSTSGRHNLNIFINQSLDSENESISEPTDSRSPVRSSSSEVDTAEERIPSPLLNLPVPSMSASDRRLNFRNLGRQKVIIDVPSSPTPEPGRNIASPSVQHAPLTRMMSAPSGKSAGSRKPTPRLVKTPSLETRIKSAPPKRKTKTPPKRKPKGDATEEDKSERRVRRGVERGEVVTMVSLVSPAESEGEDEEAAAAAAAAATADVLSSFDTSEAPTPEPMKPNPPPPVISFRKPHKVVTFRPTAIIQSPVTQYQTNFSLKRTGTPSPGGNGTMKSQAIVRQNSAGGGAKPTQDLATASPPNKKPGSIQRQASLAPNFVFKKGGGGHETPSMNAQANNEEVKCRSDEIQKPHNVPTKKPQQPLSTTSGSRRKILQSTPTVIKIEPLPVKEVELERQPSHESPASAPSTISLTVCTAALTSTVDAVEMEFPREENERCHLEELKTTKERECWQLFKKMSSKGVSVSFDTVCRGLLTPTEYRMRRTALMAAC